uniref:Putative salivary kunitz domain protein n=1 Tax=Ixodes ricinus TaxID=34613 RepID=A0A0K8RFC0_IXORI
MSRFFISRLSKCLVRLSSAETTFLQRQPLRVLVVLAGFRGVLEYFPYGLFTLAATFSNFKKVFTPFRY